MGKHQKLTTPTVPAADKPRDATGDATAHDVDGTLTRMLGHLQRCIGVVESSLDSGEATPALLRESATVARAVVQLSGEQRARQKAFVRVARSLTGPLVMEYLRHLGEAERESLFQELDAAFSDGSVLS